MASVQASRRSLGSGTISLSLTHRGGEGRNMSSLPQFCVTSAPSKSFESDQDASIIFPTTESLASTAVGQPSTLRRDADDASACSTGSYSLGAGTFEAQQGGGCSVEVDVDDGASVFSGNGQLSPSYGREPRSGQLTSRPRSLPRTVSAPTFRTHTHSLEAIRAGSSAHHWNDDTGTLISGISCPDTDASSLSPSKSSWKRGRKMMKGPRDVAKSIKRSVRRSGSLRSLRDDASVFSTGSASLRSLFSFGQSEVSSISEGGSPTRRRRPTSIKKIARSVRSRSPFRRKKREESDKETVSITSAGSSTERIILTAQQPASPPKRVAGGGSSSPRSPPKIGGSAKLSPRGGANTTLSTVDSDEASSSAASCGAASTKSQRSAIISTIREDAPLLQVNGSFDRGGAISRSFDLSDSVDVTSVYFEQHRALPLLSVEESWDEEERGWEDDDDDDHDRAKHHRAYVAARSAGNGHGLAAARALSASIGDAPPELCGRLTTEEVMDRIRAGTGAADALQRLRRLHSSGRDIPSHIVVPASTPPPHATIHGIAMPDYDSYVDEAVDAFRTRLGISDRLYEDMKENIFARGRV